MLEESMKSYKVCVIGDFHDSPKMSKDRIVWIAKHIKKTKPDYIIQIGDFSSIDSCCWHIKNDTMAARRNKGTLLEDLESLETVLELFNKTLGKSDIPKHVTLGNHENRLWKWEEANPEYYNMGKKQLLDLFTKYGWTYSSYGKFHFIGGVGFIHCPLNIMGKEFGGVGAERNIGLNSLFDVVYGHSHKSNDVRVPKIGTNNYTRVINVGCSMPDGHIEDYAKLGVTGWWWGLVDVQIYENHIQEVKTTTMKNLGQLYG